jgi:S-adenosylmethionine:tRNA ribosyltransferase-isomerase
MTALLAPDRPLPSGKAATAPIERRGGCRDDVRLLLAHGATLSHHRLRDLPDLLDPGDVVVVNTSAVVPASLPVRRADGSAARLHLATTLPGGWWVVELRAPAGPVTLPCGDGQAGEVLALPAGGTATLLAPHGTTTLPAPHGKTPGAPVRLWLAAVEVGGDLLAFLDAHGAPIRYGHPDAPWPLADYQTVFAREPGSAESPSAGRAFTGTLVARLVAAGVGVHGVTLHCGVSSPEAHEAPLPERYAVPAATARAVAAARTHGSRVVAVGTTVVRALETTADAGGIVHPGRGWTELVIGPDRPVRAVDGLLTGWHEPEASHLDMITAVAGTELTRRSYAEATRTGYRWHEFGDLHLILP